MSGYLRRLATTGAAYTAANVLSKLIAVALLPLYTRYLTPADYGAAEVLFAAVVSASIVIRLGVIEALLRFYYKAGEDPEAVVATSFAALFWVTTVASLIALPFAGPISEAILDEARPGPDADRDRRPLGRDLARVPADPVPARGARKGVLRGDDHQCPRGDRAHRRSRRRPGRGGAWPSPRQLRQRRRRRPGADLHPPAPPLALVRPHPAAADHALRAADDAGRALALRAQLRRPDHHRPHRRPDRGRALLAGGEVRPGRQRPRSRLPARLAAARLLDPRRRGGPPRLRRCRHLVHGRLRVRRDRDVAASRAGSCGPWRLPNSSTPTKRSG